MRNEKVKVDINACVQDPVAKALAMDWHSFAALSDCKLFAERVFQELTVRSLALKSQHVASNGDDCVLPQ